MAWPRAGARGPRPRGANPLTHLIEASVDFAAVAASPLKLFVTATNVRTGRGRVFRNAELSPDVLLAEWPFFCMLRDEGRRAADTFLHQHGHDLGQRSSMDLAALLEGI